MRFEQTYRALRAVIDKLPHEFTLICVDDGSSDATPALLRRLAKNDKRVQIIELSRNFGHQAALSAGLSAVEGKCRADHGRRWPASA